ncbi:MAG: Cof-type HAD-IIB family hydrolase [Bacteroidales bacterium]|jgi:Cof subfamily protein (haloacid dehalogenase superfamily)|nr:Cof-type HAD-IIB family hydrolase [Bacteroidales bacterium]
MYQAIICDLDGTLLNSQHTISKYTQEVIKAVKEKDMLICIATGRHHPDALAYQQMLGLDSYLITCNGAKIHDEKDREIFSGNMPADIAHDLIHTVVDSEIIRHVFQDEVWYCDQPGEIVTEAYKDSGVIPIDRPFHLIMGDITRVCFEYRRIPNKLFQLEETLIDRFGDQLNICFSSSIFLEVFRKGVSKGAAIQEILRQKGIDMNQTIAFGDSLNDYDMLKTVGKGILMGNSNLSLRHSLPGCEVIDTNDNDGLARYLEHLFL